MDKRINKLAPNLKSDFLEKVFNLKVVENLIYNFGITQYFNFSQQLNIGIRFFDLRVTMHNGTLHYVHGLYGEKVLPTLAVFKTFTEEHPTEIVILDFQHMYLMNDTVRAIEYHKIKSIFGARSKSIHHTLISMPLYELRRKGISILIRWPYLNKIRNENGIIINPYMNTDKVHELLTFDMKNNGFRLDCIQTLRLYISQLILTIDLNKLASQIIRQRLILSMTTLYSYFSNQRNDFNEYIITSNTTFNVVYRDFADHQFSNIVIRRNFY